MAKDCLVIPTEELVRARLLPRDSEGKVVYEKLSERGGASAVYRLAETCGEYRPRYGEGGVETDSSYQQLIMYAFFVKNRAVLAYRRDPTASRGEKRLSGKISVGIGGHMERTDLNLEGSLWRELDEEAEIVLDGAVASFRDQSGALDIETMKHLLDIKPVGLLKDGRDEVGMVHLGIVCRITPKKPGVDVRLKTGDEAVSSSYLTLDEYETLVSEGAATPEGWTEIVMEREVKSLLKSDEENTRGVAEPRGE